MPLLLRAASDSGRCCLHPIKRGCLSHRRASALHVGRDLWSRWLEKSPSLPASAHTAAFLARDLVKRTFRRPPKLLLSAVSPILLQAIRRCRLFRSAPHAVSAKKRMLKRWGDAGKEWRDWGGCHKPDKALSRGFRYHRHGETPHLGGCALKKGRQT